MTSLLKQEIIGKHAEIIKAKNKSNIGIKGKIIDETKYTLTLNGKKVFKNNIDLAIKHENKIIMIKGHQLIGRPKERIKK